MEQRQNGVTEEERRRFSCLWTAAEKRVAGVFSGERQWDAEGMTQWVCEKAFRKYAGTLALEREDRERGTEFRWTGWFMTIARRLLFDEKRRERRLREIVGKPVALEWRVAWRVERPWKSDGEKGTGSWWRQRALTDERAPGMEEMSEWKAVCGVLHELLAGLPVLESRALLLWGETPNDVKVSRRLKLSESTVRRARVRGLARLRLGLEERGYFRESRPRQPHTNGWGFVSLERRGEATRRRKRHGEAA